MGNKHKGSDFEREICTQLSLWWTAGARDDIFWRSSGSGARATGRTKRGKSTAGQYGDIASTDPIGQPLTKLLVFELKRGYSTRTPADTLDRADSAAEQLWESFIRQAEHSARSAKAFGWAIISRRDRRNAWVWFPTTVRDALRECGAWAAGPPWPRASLATEIRKVGMVKFCGMELTGFLGGVQREHIETLADEW